MLLQALETLYLDAPAYLSSSQKASYFAGTIINGIGNNCKASMSGCFKLKAESIVSSNRLIIFLSPCSFKTELMTSRNVVIHCVRHGNTSPGLDMSKTITIRAFSICFGLNGIRSRSRIRFDAANSSSALVSNDYRRNTLPSSQMWATLFVFDPETLRRANV